MNKKKYLLFSLLFSAFWGSLLFTGCNKDDSSEQKAKEKQLLQEYVSKNYPNATPQKDGLYFILDSAKTTLDAKPDSGDFVLVEFTGKVLSTGKTILTTDSAVAQQNGLYNSEIVYGNSKFQLSPYNFLYGVYEGIKLMKEGQTATLLIPSDLALGEYEYTNVPKYSTLIYTVHLVKIIHDPVAYERQQINNFLKSTPLTPADSTNSGLYYYKKVQSSGSVIKNGDVISVSYVGKYLDGRTFLCDTATNVKLTASTVLNSGFDEGLRCMKKGEESVFIVPYYLGFYGGTAPYALTYYVTIPAYTTLLYDVKVN
ncbi:MAG: FKBP-type peptidyl-prolyl cis-trans isomerase [Bacteroidota bacterium]|nr:FKBP-type peptidyl-prolyl cis-trans isomerase [Bacteroidota bacterium]MDP4225495.1 FKBP-type peptidyl-prolyl cis-trans isomerase [Bacteroidota bacterium]MDP4274196.1 FKBP-type peptidyl-prolyl cis-trans isomerase [Bacteroidota bacterium]